MRTLLRFTCGFLLSALCAIFLCSGLHLYLAAAVLLVLSILLCILRPRIGVALLGFALGLFWTAGYQAIFIAPSQALAGSVRTIYGEAQITVPKRSMGSVFRRSSKPMTSKCGPWYG